RPLRLRLPRRREARVEPLVRVRAVDRAQGGQVAGEAVAGVVGRVVLDQGQQVVGTGAETDDARRVALAVAYVLDVAVGAAPVQRPVLRARDDLLGQLLLRRARQPRPVRLSRGGTGSGRGAAGHRDNDEAQGREQGTFHAPRLRSDRARGAADPPETDPPPGRPSGAYVSHSSTVRHSPHRARTRPRTGTLMRFRQVGQGKDTFSGPLTTGAIRY